MPDSDELLGQNLVDVRNEERRHRNAVDQVVYRRPPKPGESVYRFPWRTRLAVLFISVCLLTVGLLMVLSKSAAAARPAVPPPVYKAVRAEWFYRSQRIKAFDVIACETGGAYNTNARNGQYLGLFQMGAWARARYGHGSTARAQAHAAYMYWRDSGWSGWECA